MAVNRMTKRWLSGNFSVVVIMVVLLVIGISITAHSYYYNAAKQYLTARADTVGTLLTNYSEDSSVDFSSQLRQLVEDFEYKEQVELMALDSDGKVFITSSGFQPEVDYEVPDFYEALISDEGTGTYIGHIAGEKVMALSSTAGIKDGSITAMRYVVSMDRVDSQILTIIVILVLIGAAVLLVVLYSGSFFINSIINPLTDISDAASKIAQGGLNTRLEVSSDDEIGDLCYAINDMAEELMTTEKIKNDFISSVSHELRTPLTAIRGWGETLKDESADESMRQRGIKIILDETDRLSSMVEDLLDFSRIQSGRLTLNKQNIDAISELSDAVMLFTERAADENKTLVYTEPLIFAPITADKNRIRQVFINIIDNALKYSDPGDSVTINADEVNGNVVITVVDTGIGISEDDLPNIKKRFYKGHTNRRGSGIGLAVVDEIVNLHGGHFEIDSVKDEGTTVTITLPLNEMAETTI